MTVGAVACSSAGTMDRPANALTGEVGATVEVTNNNWSDMVVYAQRNGVKVRLGTVTSMTTESFRLPVPLLSGSGELFFIADPIGSDRAYRSPVVMVGRGQRVEFMLENNLALSSLTVW
ncbi:MAG: hypothetical protein GX539_16975 [Candidatus Cloacimonetes bacterium]|nr:hypothetical protein [Candidatus Cloacimonadota bacterium]